MIPMISFIIPAHNEEVCLPATLDALLAAARQVGRPHEVIVVNDASTDGTRAVASQRGVRVIDVAYRHIAATRNAGARAACGDILFFVDADTQATAEAITAGLRAIGRGAVGGACHFRYDGPIPWWARLLHPVGNALGRLLTVAGGAFLFCRRSEFEAVGGFCERYFAAEDLVFVRALKRRGWFVIARPVVLTSNRKVRTMSLGRAVSELFRVVVRGPESYRRREGLGLWYGPEARDAGDTRPRPSGAGGQPPGAGGDDARTHPGPTRADP
jgi:glycosyltransferase involved in cell wall biosynthesis